MEGFLRCEVAKPIDVTLSDCARSIIAFVRGVRPEGDLWADGRGRAGMSRRDTLLVLVSTWM